MVLRWESFFEIRVPVKPRKMICLHKGARDCKSLSNSKCFAMWSFRSGQRPIRWAFL